MMGLLSKMDGWLLSSIYQRLANVARSSLGINAHWLSAVTASLMICAIIRIIIRAFVTMKPNAGSLEISLLMVLVLVHFWWLYVCCIQVKTQIRLARRLDDEAVMGRHAIRSAEVIRGQSERIYWIIVLSILCSLSAGRGMDFDLSYMGFLCWMSSLYFAACMTPPRRRKKQGAGFLSRFAAPSTSG